MRKIILITAIAATAVLGGLVLKQWVWPKMVAQVDQPSGQSLDDGRNPEWEKVQKWLDSAGPSGRSALRMQVIRPGIILPPEAKTFPPAPDDLRIVVTRHGNRPARIEVRHGDRQWEVTEEQLDQLPPDIRMHVERPLGWVLEGPAAKAAMSNLMPPATQTDDPLQKRLDELNSRVDALFESIENLKEK